MALGGLRNREVAFNIGTHLNVVVKTKANGFGTDDAWTYMIQTAAAADKTANEMGFASPRSAPTNNVSVKVLNNNRVNFDEATAVFHSDSEDYDRDQTNTAAGTNAVRPVNDSWKASVTCYHCGENGYIATDCTGRCPACRGYRGAHEKGCERMPRPKGKGKKGGGKGADNRRADHGRNGYEADGESFWYARRNVPYVPEKDTDKYRRDDRRKEEGRQADKQKRVSRTDSDEEGERKRRKQEKSDVDDHRSPRSDKRYDDKRDKSVERAKRREKDRAKSDRSDEKSSKNDSSRG